VTESERETAGERKVRGRERQLLYVVLHESRVFAGQNRAIARECIGNGQTEAQECDVGTFELVRQAAAKR
jgi:hypothetical protein